ncbi:pantetheine-phosphate adenylyltransferase [Pseudobacteriovorax antillogorgiicola]|uniref:Phosphopantetheine adenylyltransferase n=1 Tax=Pseudobacteriovorax antillogorgiicola TaxID=1513793 RepID=A0A1Y6B7J3_9BACT|nr:pantetheine-phosphate adenylyltransferase [Pseudobacteriovorax antillogorgiicola]TCS58593.1 phosphopantetheine adenylyltransferase [Pseudobacteriovorax antillogorgiicola]SME97116.1 Phosphopantetheine adenylyltransferase [Pseudobacteriovorax antillogorgiicola]
MKVAVFAGSFDPFTLGHEDIVEQALHVFDRLVIGVGQSSSKRPLFSDEERVEIIQDIYKDRPEISVKAFAGLVVDFARKENATCLVRGLRTEADFSYEMPMAMTNHKISPEIQTVFFPTKSQFAYVSSSLVKELSVHGGDVSSFVPPMVVARMSQKNS